MRSHGSPPDLPPRPNRPAAAITAVAIAAAALATNALLVSCAAEVRPVVALDEAFVATRPGLAAGLQDSRALGAGLWGLFGGPRVVSVALTEGAGKALDATIAEGTHNGKPGILITSPLIAKAIIGGGAWSGDPPLLVPEWRGSPVPGLWSATTDPIPAYRAAGAAAGAFVAALSKSGGSPSCGVLFSETPSRPRAALAAFAAAYADASEGRPLYVRELDGGYEATAAQGKQPQPSASGAAEEAVAELLGSDIRVLFVALGPDAGAAIRAAARPGLAIGADFPFPETSRSLSFRISPDDSALVRELVSERRALRGGARGGETRAVPALLSAGAQASSVRAGKLDFRRFLEDAALRAKGSR
jgi:hypothetical protein